MHLCCIIIHVIYNNTAYYYYLHNVGLQLKENLVTSQIWFMKTYLFRYP